MLWNVIGGPNQSMAPQITRSPLKLGDALLLCSDGLTRYLEDAEILTAVSQPERTAAETCQRLIEEANQRGGIDNITALVARFNRNDVAAVEQHHAHCSSDMPPQPTVMLP